VALQKSFSDFDEFVAVFSVAAMFGLILVVLLSRVLRTSLEGRIIVGASTVSLVILLVMNVWGALGSIISAATCVLGSVILMMREYRLR